MEHCSHHFAYSFDTHMIGWISKLGSNKILTPTSQAYVDSSWLLPLNTGSQLWHLDHACNSTLAFNPFALNACQHPRYDSIVRQHLGKLSALPIQVLLLARGAIVTVMSQSESLRQMLDTCFNDDSRSIYVWFNVGLWYQITDEVERFVNEKKRESGVSNESNISGDDYEKVQS